MGISLGLASVREKYSGLEIAITNYTKKLVGATLNYYSSLD